MVWYVANVLYFMKESTEIVGRCVKTAELLVSVCLSVCQAQTENIKSDVRRDLQVVRPRYAIK